MAEPLSTIELIDSLSDLIADARALEMAISGSSSLEQGERRALIRQSEKLGDAVKAVHDAVDAAHEAAREREAEQ